VPKRSPQRVVFDLDGVIARGDTMAVLVQRRLTGHAGRAALGILPGAAWYLLRGLPGMRVGLSRALGRIALSGLDGAEYAALAAGIGADLGRDPDWIIADGLAAIRGHIDAGDDVVVTTGTETMLARAFLDAIGLSEVRLIATTLEFDRAGAHYANHNLGGRKVANLAGSRIDLFYTDSNLDLPLAALASHTVLINPDARLEREFRARIDHVTVERWI
jgi:phosphatidylglycerophosphatase C